MRKLFEKIKEKVNRYAFLFEELSKRDFKQKYKGTALGMLWSVLNPLFTLLIMRLVFTQFFGRGKEHYTTYLFCGNLIMSFFREATMGGLNALSANASILTKVNVPKYMFVMSRNVSATINFLCTFAVFLLFCAIDRITFGWHFFALLYPMLCVILLNIGTGLILSAMNVFFRDTASLYSIFLLLLNYLSAIFYTVESYPENVQRLFLLNPIYVYIKYFRLVTIDGTIPSLLYHLLCLLYAGILLLIGAVIYKKNNHRFIYYL